MKVFAVLISNVVPLEPRLILLILFGLLLFKNFLSFDLSLSSQSVFFSLDPLRLSLLLIALDLFYLSLLFFLHALEIFFGFTFGFLGCLFCRFCFCLFKLCFACLSCFLFFPKSFLAFEIGHLFTRVQC